MGRPDLVDDLLGYAPTPLRDYVADLERQLEGERIPEPYTRGADDPSENRLGHFARESSTSRKAALDNYPRSGTQRERCLRAIVGAGARGLTSDEIAERHHMRLYSVKPRLIELREGGWIERNGDTRPSPTGSDVDVYVATAKGRTEVSRRLDAEEAGV